MFNVEAMKKACLEPKIRKEALKDITRISKEHKLNRYEYCRALNLVVDPFTEEMNLMTPT
jgi:long-chain acyl-CoA synthetase